MRFFQTHGLALMAWLVIPLLGACSKEPWDLTPEDIARRNQISASPSSWSTLESAWCDPEVNLPSSTLSDDVFETLDFWINQSGSSCRQFVKMMTQARQLKLDAPENQFSGFSSIDPLLMASDENRTSSYLTSLSLEGFVISQPEQWAQVFSHFGHLESLSLLGTKYRSLSQLASIVPATLKQLTLSLYPPVQTGYFSDERVMEAHYQEMSQSLCTTLPRKLTQTRRRSGVVIEYLDFNATSQEDPGRLEDSRIDVVIHVVDHLLSQSDIENRRWESGASQDAQEEKLSWDEVAQMTQGHRKLCPNQARVIEIDSSPSPQVPPSKQEGEPGDFPIESGKEPSTVPSPQDAAPGEVTPGGTIEPFIEPLVPSSANPPSKRDV